MEYIYPIGLIIGLIIARLLYLRDMDLMVKMNKAGITDSKYHFFIELSDWYSPPKWVDSSEESAVFLILMVIWWPITLTILTVILIVKLIDHFYNKWIKS
jgi:hypothetical protein